MSLQWGLVAGFLYLELGLIALLVLPVLTPRRWQKIFRSRVLSVLQSQSMFYFYAFLVVLTLLLLDAFREMRKYSSVNDDPASVNIQADMQKQIRLFRAQRNAYISGFALFLFVVIQRLVVYISALATSQAQNEASMKQAESASTAARKLLNQTADAGQNAANEAHEKVVADLKKEIATLKAQLEKEKKDLQAMKSQAEATNKEFDRLTSEYSKLQKQVAAAGGSGDKKAD